MIYCNTILYYDILYYAIPGFPGLHAASSFRRPKLRALPGLLFGKEPVGRTRDNTNTTSTYHYDNNTIYTSTTRKHTHTHKTLFGAPRMRQACLGFE